MGRAPPAGRRALAAVRGDRGAQGVRSSGGSTVGRRAEKGGGAGAEPAGEVVSDNAGVVGGVNEVVDQPSLRPGMAEAVGAKPAPDRAAIRVSRIGRAQRQPQAPGGVWAMAERDD